MDCQIATTYSRKVCAWRLNATQCSAKGIGIPQAIDAAVILGSLPATIRSDFAIGGGLCLLCTRVSFGSPVLLVASAGYVSRDRVDSLSARHFRDDLESLRDSDRQLLSISTLTQRERRAVALHYLSTDRRAQWIAVIEAYKRPSVKEF
jgi:hypothetical protein